ncbi:hypothetical protein GPNCGGLF_LOCUS1177 [Methylorubrum aminovorans]
MGLMMYNTMEFVGVPIDVLIRRFRTEKDCVYDSCEHACFEFLRFIASFKRSDADEISHLISIISEEFKEIDSEHQEKLSKQVFDWIQEYPGKAPDIDRIGEDLIISIIARHTHTHISRPLPGYLADKSVSDFAERYGATCLLIARQSLARFLPNQRVAEALIELSFAAIKSEVFSDGLTGLVFGGFGKNDIFPSLYAIEIDGIFFGSVKFKKYQSVDIDRRGERAAIIPFAQSEMVERFLFGIDSSLERVLVQFVRDTSTKAVTALRDAGVDTSTLKIDSSDYTDDVQRLLTRLKLNSKNEILDMVDFMPKQELTYAAEAFISLTSVKRKVSAQQETVGGPIDVAVITKNEGFVWIKRKHYFDLELNSTYGVKLHRQALTEEQHERPRTQGRKNRRPPQAKRGNFR